MGKELLSHIGKLSEASCGKAASRVLLVIDMAMHIHDPSSQSDVSCSFYYSFQSEINNTDSATADPTKSHDLSSSTGGWRTMPFIFANEIIERLAGSGFSANLVTYLTQRLHMTPVAATNFFTIYGGAITFAPFIGAILADTYIGRFWTIAIGSMLYFAGISIWTVSATVPSLQPAPCCPSSSPSVRPVNCCPSPSTKQMAVPIIGYMILGLGAGGMRPCIAAFGADQVFNVNAGSGKGKADAEQVPGHGPKHGMKQLNLGSFFNWYYFCLCVAGLLGMTVIVYIQDNVGWGWGFGIPAVLSFLAAIAFITGLPLYNRVAPMGSPYKRLVRVVVAAFRKRRLSAEHYADPLYELSKMEFATQFPDHQAPLAHTEQFKFLDRAAMRVPQDSNEDGSIKSWRLSTVTEVEELKLILRMFPIWASGILLTTASTQQYTFTILQAQTMDRRMGHKPSFEIPAGSMSAFTLLTLLVTLPLYDRVFVPAIARITGSTRGITFMQRMGAGLLLSTLATAVAAVVEAKRKQVAKSAGLLDSPSAIIPISVFYLLPQYCLHGLADTFMAIGSLDFFYDQAPQSLKCTATALFSLNSTIGYYLSTILVTLIVKYTRGPNTWLPENLNRGHLDYFYWLLAGLQLVNFFIFCITANWYKYKKLIHAEEIVEKYSEEYTSLGT